jgi:hypothetical protein
MGCARPLGEETAPRSNNMSFWKKLFPARSPEEPPPEPTPICVRIDDFDKAISILFERILPSQKVLSEKEALESLPFESICVQRVRDTDHLRETLLSAFRGGGRGLTLLRITSYVVANTMGTSGIYASDLADYASITAFARGEFTKSSFLSEYGIEHTLSNGIEHRFNKPVLICKTRKLLLVKSLDWEAVD